MNRHRAPHRASGATGPPRRARRRSRGRTLPAIALLCAGVLLGAPAGAQVISEPLPQVDWIQRLGDQVPMGTKLVDESGSTVVLSDLMHGKPAILALVYYDCPMLCNLVLQGLTDTLKKVPYEAGKDFEVLVVSIDPGETPDMARARHQRYRDAEALSGDDSAWHFLVGAEDQVKALADSVGFVYTYVPTIDQYAHPAGITILTGDGTVSRVLFGIEYEPRDMRLALVDAGEGTIGTPIDKVLLRCFCYDPANGKYGFAIMTVIRVAGSATLLVLGGFVLLAIRHDRKKRARAEARVQGASSF